MKHQFAGSSALLDNAPVSRGDTLRSMIELLRHEREALTGMDMDSIMGCAHDK
jgi:hypothetical protein